MTSENLKQLQSDNRDLFEDVSKLIKSLESNDMVSTLDDGEPAAPTKNPDLHQVRKRLLLRSHL